MSKDQDKKLAALRKDIDSIDRDLHALLMKRFDVVEKIQALKGATELALRPGREAMVLKGLLDRHSGGFPAVSLVRIWREIFSAHAFAGRPFKVAVHAREDRCGVWDDARDAFGSSVTLIPCASTLATLRTVQNDTAQIAVVPWPIEDIDEPWWLRLHGDAPRLHVIARLPYVKGTNARRDADYRADHALVVAPCPPEETGHDRTLLLLECEDRVSTSRLREVLTACDLSETWRGPVQETHHIWYLVEVDGYVTRDHQAIAALTEKLSPFALHVLGSYAVITP